MYFLRIISAAYVLSSICLTAYADDYHQNRDSALRNRLYASLFVGKAYPANKLDYKDFEVARPGNAGVFGVGIGYKIDDNLRADLNLAYFTGFKYDRPMGPKGDDNSEWKYFQKLKATTFFANAYYDFNIDGVINPYVTAGLGISANNSGSFIGDGVYKAGNKYAFVMLADDTKYSFAWNVGVGLALRINDIITWDIVNYKYYHLGNYSSGSGRIMNDNGTVNLVEAGEVKTKLAVHLITTQFRINF